MDHLLPIWLQYLSIPYVYGGKSPLNGLDCSGLSRILLLAGGIVIPKEIQSAQHQHDYFGDLNNHTDQKIRCGTLIFYGTYQKVHHVAMAIDSYRHIEAGHGDSSIKTVEDAVVHNAYSRVSAIRFNADFFACFFPDYPDYKAP